jgi:hypothetical protein
MFREGDDCKITFRDLLWFDARSLQEVVKE